MREANLCPSGAPPSFGRGMPEGQGGWLPCMIDSALPALSSRAKPRDLPGRRENGECEIAWETGNPVEPSGKKADVPERFLDFAQNDDTRIRIVKHAGGQPPPFWGTSFQRKEGESRPPPFLWKGGRRAGGWLPRMIDSALPASSSRAKPRDLPGRRENGEREIA